MSLRVRSHLTQLPPTVLQYDCPPPLRWPALTLLQFNRA